jgi:hypothetical protein
MSFPSSGSMNKPSMKAGVKHAGYIPEGRTLHNHRCENLESSYKMVAGALSLGVGWWGCEADHSPSSNVEFKDAYSFTSPPPYVFVA